MPSSSRWSEWAKRIRTETYALYFAVRDERTPWYAKALGLCVVAYALSPIDLIPDFIPVLGYLDDLLIVPAGLWLVRSLIPSEVLAESRQRAEQNAVGASRSAAIAIVVIWSVLILALAAATWRHLRSAQ
jgi:uncharacterized membrane protein YkvA (DUF1232 family)